MSRGAGHVERKIADIFADNPDKFFAAGTLCQMIWPGLNRIEHKHRVSVNRAASRIAEKTKWTRTSMPSWTAFKGVVLFVGPKATEVPDKLAEANNGCSRRKTRCSSQCGLAPARRSADWLATLAFS